jgi:hypothetical protein
LNHCWYLSDSKRGLIKKLNHNYQLEANLGEGFVSLKFKEKLGVMDEMGNLITPFVYCDVEKFEQGFFPVYQYIQDCYGEFDDHYSGWGLIEKSGKLVVGFQFFEPPQVANDLIIGVDSWRYLYGAIDFNQRIVVPFDYDSVAGVKEQLKLL